MIEKIYIIYTIVDDILKVINHREDKRQKMTDSEVITTALISTIVFGGNMEKARAALYQTGLIPNILSKSRLCRRIHALSDLIKNIFFHLGIVFKQANISMEYVLDSFPVPICDNIRIKRCRIVQSEQCRGYIPSKKRYFYGVRVHVLATSDGIPVEIVFMPGAPHDSNALYELPFYLPERSEIYTDSAYTNYDIEDDLQQADGIILSPIRKKNSSRWDEPPVRWYKKYIRKRIETVFSEISNYFPKKIHAVTFNGFLLKILLFVLGFTMDKAFC
jgi:hypothetical protein